MKPEIRLLILVIFFFAVEDSFGVSIFTCSTKNLAAIEYAAGVAQARAGDYASARKIFEFGLLRNQNDLRFLSELAGISYRGGDREGAKKYLYELLKINPKDPYANRFLGTLFLLDGNIEASLKYWNRIGLPRIEQIELQPVPPVHPELMDRALVVAPASSLTRQDFLETESRLQMMGIFKKYEFRLRPRRNEESFDLLLRPQIRKGTLASGTKAAALVAQGILSQTIKPEFHNIDGTTISWTSLISWDQHKNRFYSSGSFPFGNNPHLRIRVFTDTRKETWAFAQDLDLLKSEGGVELGEILNSRLKWTSGAKLSYRSYKNTNIDQQQLFEEGWLIQMFGSTDFSLFRVPERRLTLNSVSTAEAGKFLHSNAFVTLEQSLELRWFPRPVGEDLAITARVRAGKSFGSIPFDEYFILGAERDTDLSLHAHRSSIEKKGENPFGPAYLLCNWEISKYFFDTKKFRWRIAPFIDAARILQTELWNRDRWFLDTGIQSGFQIFGATELVLTYGKDLRTGRNVLYFSTKL